eukprot:PhM_4_TR18470/c1_g1_i1/m.32539
MSKPEKVVLESEDGVYEGEAVDGIPHGRGKFVFVDGDVYDGEWVDNEQTGRGRYTWSDGEYYDGEFLQNLRHGFGVMKNDDVTFEGNFVQNLRCGHGTQKTKNTVYDGEFHNDKRHGRGKVTFGDGSFYDGHWVNDERCGVGYFRMADGNVYEGEFARDQPNGKGEYRWADGGVFIGYFLNGQRHGEGFERLANGDWLAGNWVNGQHDGKTRVHKRGDETIRIFTSTVRNVTPTMEATGTVSGIPKAPLTTEASGTVAHGTVRNPNTATQPTPQPAAASAPASSAPVETEDLNGGVPFETLAKNISVGRLLGKGSFGSVFEAILPNGRVVALKVIELGSISNSESEMQALTNEISLLSRLKHRNIVRLEGCVEDKENNKMCIFMEYVSGGTLNSFLKKFSKLSPNIIRNYTVQILAGVRYLHEHDVVHRDIKGDNILVGNDGVVKLADFGCSREINSLCSKTHGCRSMVGTPYWMAPEVIRDDSTGYGPKADIWSVGCTIVEMLTGKPPWPEFNSMWTAIYHIAHSTGLPSQIPNDLPPEIMDFLLKTFDRDPMTRASAAELMEHPWLKEISATYRC